MISNARDNAERVYIINFWNIEDKDSDKGGEK